MGKFDQRRLVRKLDLERFIAKVESNPTPEAKLEQYTLSEPVAASILYLAAYTFDDIEGKNVLDLGCGTGRLALGAAFLGAESVVGVDIDQEVLKVAAKNSNLLGFKGRTSWIAGDIDSVAGNFDTVVQNPPFGVQTRTADRKFIEKALESANTVYSIHNHPFNDKQLLCRLKANGGQPMQVEANSFLSRFINTRGGRVEAVYALPLTIPRMFDFHTKARHDIIIDLYVIRK
ncbi:MAG TPA: METTL5 family protein [Candidatus Nanoarchaeia archaeon]|nr:METTL5 family protein [Candidatus Nanoarchaeia archaeon]